MKKSPRIVFVFFPLAFFLATSSVFTSLFAQTEKPVYTIRARAERESADYAQGEKATFKVELLENKTPLFGKTIAYTVQGDGGYEVKGNVTTAEKPAVIEASLDRPGMLKCSLSWKADDGKTIHGLAGAAVAPLEIRSARPEPEDFDAFWTAEKKKLDAIPMNPKLVPFEVDKYKAQGFEVYDVKVDCVDGVPVSGYLAKPIDATKGSLPIVINYHGAGVRSSNIPLGDARNKTIALDINAHGLDNGLPTKHYEDLYAGPMKNYRWVGQDDREKCYFKGMFLRVVRSLEFMKSLPEWDGKNIVVKGGSQGGGQALVAAGIDPQVTLCAAFVPAICYHTGYVDQEFGGWPGFLKPFIGKEPDPAILKTVPYFDAAIFAKRIKAECFLSTGYIDYTCSPTSVYVAYNNIKAPKQIVVTPETTHTVPESTRLKIGKLLWDALDKARVVPR